jgi:hypothetical protein
MQTKTIPDREEEIFGWKAIIPLVPEIEEAEAEFLWIPDRNNGWGWGWENPPPWLWEWILKEMKETKESVFCLLENS